MTVRCVILIFFIFNYGCSVSLISDYDEQSLIQMENLSEKIDRMYIHMSSSPSDNREFEEFSDDYIDVEAGLNRLKFRQENRSLNELTIKQVNIITETWKADMMKHKEKNTINDFMIKRGRSVYRRLFGAMIRGESSKPKKN